MQEGQSSGTGRRERNAHGVMLGRGGRLALYASNGEQRAGEAQPYAPALVQGGQLQPGSLHSSTARTAGPHEPKERIRGHIERAACALNRWR